MNNRLQLLRWAALLGAAALVSCQGDRITEADLAPEEEISRQARNDIVVTFHATQAGMNASGEAQTKAAFGAEENGVWPTLWTDNDTELKLSLNYGTAQAAAVTPSEDHRGATFSATVDFSGIDGPYTFYAVSPSASAKALSPSREVWKVSIPCEQTPSAGSADENAIIIAAASAEFATAAGIGEVDLPFSHLTAYGCMSLDNFTLGSGETLQAVELTVTTPFVGDWYWKCEPEQGEHTLIDYGASSTLTLHPTSPSDIWFGCAPVDVSGEVLAVNVYTSVGVYTYETLFPDNCQFTAGQVAIFSVDMDGITATAGGSASDGSFTLVTDASALTAGDEVLIVYTSGGQALGAVSGNGNYRETKDVTISGGTIASAGDATVLTLVAGSSDGTWAFKDGQNYLTSPTASSNYLLNSTSVSANSSWTVTVTSGGAATIVAKEGGRTYLRYNTGSPRFSCYQSASVSNTQTPSLYRRPAGSGGVSLSDPMLQHTVYGCYLGTGLEWEFNPGSDQVTRSYNASDVQTYTLINPATVDELEITGYKRTLVKGDDVKVTVSWRRGSTTLLSNAEYTMTLIKEDGPKVWLSDGTHGVIIKK